MVWVARCALFEMGVGVGVGVLPETDSPVRYGTVQYNTFWCIAERTV
jgi:hypothetical protein